MHNETGNIIKYFKFLNFWIDHPDYTTTVREAWNEPIYGNPLYILHQKLKNTCKTLSSWSRSTFGDIYEEPKKLEAQIRHLESTCLNDNSDENRCELSRCRAEYTRYLKLQSSILRQKARIKWLEDGDANTSFFHAIINDKRRKLSIKKIMNEQHQWIEGNAVIAEAAVEYYQNLFTPESTTNNMDALDYLERSITEEDNVMLTATPTLQEVKGAVFSIDPDSAPGTDGLSSAFYQSAWEVIGQDLHKKVLSVFSGATLPKYFTHTCIVMIPKVQHPQKFSDLRPISLCNVSSKVISKVINNRLATILLRIISKNQSGFVKGRAITENILLAQEIINDIKRPNRGKNVVIKLDMTKAYDRVSWPYLCQALRKTGFSNYWVSLIYRFIANNWYTMIVNGVRHGFFKSERGLRQGDPLSPSLFILSAELLSQMLNRLQNNARHQGFYMSIHGPQINHLTFVDDTILFCNGSKRSIREVMDILKEYELISGQLINKNKSNFSMNDSTDANTLTRIQQLTGMRHQSFLITYLGCPLFAGKKKLSHFSGLINKITGRIRGWHTKLLSSGGRVVLIRHILLALPIHLLSAVHPLKETLEAIEKYMARFFWLGKDSGGKHHLISWENLCYPYQEGGTNFRRLKDICQAFKCKQWWNLRNSSSLWSEFMKAKYFLNNHPTTAQCNKGN